MRHIAFARLIVASAVGVLASACACFVHPGLRQEFRPLVYRFHGSIPSTWHASINAAASTWNNTYNMFSSGGLGGGGTFANDGVNSIFMYPFPQPTVLAGIALPGVNATCGITDTDMGWNTAKSFSTSGAQYDVQTVALHEFGHYGVLDHVSCPSNSVMVASYRGTRRSLSGCDRLGMRVANNSPRCRKATGACRPSFFGLTAAFDQLDDEDQGAVAPMSRNVEELNLIWQGDSTLRASSDSVGSFYDSLLEDWYDGGTAADYEIFTSARYAELDAQIISRIYASASTQLRGDLDLLRQHLQTKIGQRIGDLFDIDVVRWPTIQPPGGDCGTQKVCT